MKKRSALLFPGKTAMKREKHVFSDQKDRNKESEACILVSGNLTFIKVFLKRFRKTAIKKQK